MKSRRLAVGVIAVAVGLTGCAWPGSSNSAETVQAGSMAGMSMAPGETMAGMAGLAASPPADRPSDAAKMVCSADIQAQIKLVLKLNRPAPVTASWRQQRYSCTYTLPMGRMVLSVQQSETKAAARAYFDEQRRRLAKTQALAGLGESAYGTTTGIVVVLKDNLSLQVDTTGLPSVFGPQQQRRTDLAYELASDVLGCWTGHE